MLVTLIPFVRMALHTAEPREFVVKGLDCRVPERTDESVASNHYHLLHDFKLNPTPDRQSPRLSVVIGRFGPSQQPTSISHHVRCV